MISFCKMQATGNDFIIINCLTEKLRFSYSNLSKFLCNRKYGVGADGVIFIEHSDVAEYKMRIFNQDGTEAGMCGNGIRCVARYLYKNIDKKNKLLIETKSGIKKVYIKKDCDSFMVKVDMGKPVLKASKIPVLLNENKIINEKYNFNGTILNINCVSMGNPHTVIFVKDVDNVNVLKLGKLVQENKSFYIVFAIFLFQVV